MYISCVYIYICIYKYIYIYTYIYISQGPRRILGRQSCIQVFVSKPNSPPFFLYPPTSFFCLVGPEEDPWKSVVHPDLGNFVIGSSSIEQVCCSVLQCVAVRVAVCCGVLWCDRLSRVTGRSS